MNESLPCNVFKEVLLSAKVTVSFPNSKMLIVPRGTKFELLLKEGRYMCTSIVHNKFVFVESTEEIEAGIKSLTACLYDMFLYM